MAWAGRHFYARAWAGLRHHSADMNTLIAVGTGAAFVFSVAATLAPGFFLAHGVAPDVYYEAVIDHHRADPARERARGARQAADLRRAARAGATCSRRRRAWCATARSSTCRSSDVRPGDVVLVRPGRADPGGRRVVLSGASAVDESMLTGESLPVAKGEGDARDRRDDQRHRRAALPRDDARRRQSVLARIVELMRDAQGSRAPIQELADRISAVFVPVVIAIAAVTFVAWLVRRGRRGAAGARLGRGGRGADHRLPLRDGARGADGGDGRDRQGGASSAC